MDIVIVPTAADVATHAADVVAARIAGTSDTVLGVATGSSPVGIDRELARRRAEGSLDLAHLTRFALDEYVGLAPEHPRSCAAYLDREVVRPFGLAWEQVRVPDASGADLGKAAEEYERRSPQPWRVRWPPGARGRSCSSCPGPHWFSTKPR